MSFTRRLLAVVSISVLMSLTATTAFAGSAEIYKAKCASCHGADGAGQTPVGKSMKIRDMRTPAVQKQTDAELQKIITDGQKKMPAYKDKLSIADISSVVAYIRGLATK